jgi:DNA (cytosine-5)-methyltransferase 1
MGKMSFPENENKPSRTITATKIANSRESIIYKSEINRLGDGEYRLPTVREAAIIMGFPITYQFIGTENNKWRIVGNAVCCSVSRAFARTVLDSFKFQPQKYFILENRLNSISKINLNSYKEKIFDKPPIKKQGARFRRHPIKDGNLTVTLSNFDIEKNSKISEGKWFTSIQYGTGKGFPIQKISDNFYEKLTDLIKEFKVGKEFLKQINNGFSDKIGNAEDLQKLYESQKSSKRYKEPTELVDSVRKIINELEIENIEIDQKKVKIFNYKQKLPIKRLFALYAIIMRSSIANEY